MKNFNLNFNFKRLEKKFLIYANKIFYIAKIAIKVFKMQKRRCLFLLSRSHQKFITYDYMITEFTPYSDLSI